MVAADKLWRRWKSDPNVKTALAQYAKVCLHQSDDLLDDMALHYKVREFGLLKYYFCAVQMGVFDDKSELWERHCKLARYRIWGSTSIFLTSRSSLNTILPVLGCGDEI
ncbi:hypothetical protein [Vibrio breoganii]|uniref:hypothetical protein n=1 Tax=Vibrio breoganii TaxID=553239 RepID=UPI001F5338A3|nr:hypothetical protein [Vibrio breoganii]